MSEDAFTLQQKMVQTHRRLWALKNLTISLQNLSGPDHFFLVFDESGQIFAKEQMRLELVSVHK